MSLDRKYTLTNKILDIAFDSYWERYEEDEVNTIERALERAGVPLALSLLASFEPDDEYGFDIRFTDTMLMLCMVHDELLSRIESLNQMIAIDDDPEEYQKDERSLLRREFNRLVKFIDQYDKERAK